ncbi:MAG: hypothetical protein ABI761_17725 [Saprospiraceae bacterium]
MIYPEGARQIAHIAITRPNKFSRTNQTIVQSVVRPIQVQSFDLNKLACIPSSDFISMYSG